MRPTGARAGCTNKASLRRFGVWSLERGARKQTQSPGRKRPRGSRNAGATMRNKPNSPPRTDRRGPGRSQVCDIAWMPRFGKQSQIWAPWGIWGAASMVLYRQTQSGGTPAAGCRLGPAVQTNPITRSGAPRRCLDCGLRIGDRPALRPTPPPRAERNVPNKPNSAPAPPGNRVQWRQTNPIRAWRAATRGTKRAEQSQFPPSRGIGGASPALPAQLRQTNPIPPGPSAGGVPRRGECAKQTQSRPWRPSGAPIIPVFHHSSPMLIVRNKASSR